jgi:membrane protease YdiL (CAAX protease family)
MNEAPQPHGIGKMLALHLIPGALLTLFFLLTAPSLLRAGYPALMSLLLAILIVLIPFELGYLYFEGRRLNGRYSLAGVVIFREEVPLWQFVLLVIALVLWGGLIFTAFSRVDSYFVRTLFAWFPVWALPANTLGDVNQYSSSALRLTLVASFALNGIAGPIVEELYFRGFLLPRIPAARWWAPLINAVLFSLYHFFSPWQNITRILALIPLVYVVAWKRNIFIGIWAHCLLNTLAMLSLLPLLFR